MVLELTWCLQSHTSSWTLGLRWGIITSRNSFVKEQTRTISCILATLVWVFHLSTPFIQHCRTELEDSIAMLSSGVSRMHGSTLLQRVTLESLKHQSIDGEKKKTIAMRFFNTSVLPRKALNRNLSWGLPLGNLLPKTRILKHRVLERKRRPNANASVLGTQRFRTLP